LAVTEDHLLAAAAAAAAAVWLVQVAPAGM
jgi:hypothetical protein